jgi:hypothetical protein
MFYVPTNDSIGTLARVMTYVILGVVGVTLVLAMASSFASPGHANTGEPGSMRVIARVMCNLVAR